MHCRRDPSFTSCSIALKDVSQTKSVALFFGDRRLAQTSTSIAARLELPGIAAIADTDGAEPKYAVKADGPVPTADDDALGQIEILHHSGTPPVARVKQGPKPFDFHLRSSKYPSQSLPSSLPRMDQN